MTSYLTYLPSFRDCARQGLEETTLLSFARGAISLGLDLGKNVEVFLNNTFTVGRQNGFSLSAEEEIIYVRRRKGKRG